jgi:hypothetical protein
MYGYFFSILALGLAALAALPVTQTAVEDRYEIQSLETGLQEEEIRRITRALLIALQDGAIAAPDDEHHILTDSELQAILLPRMAPIQESVRILPLGMSFAIDPSGSVFHVPAGCEDPSCHVDVVERYRPKHTPPNPISVEPEPAG